MKRELVYLFFPCRIIVCDRNVTDKGTNDLLEYARIIPQTKEIGGIWFTRFEFAGEIEWTKHADLLSAEELRRIERQAASIAEEYKEQTEKAKALQAYQRIKYADKIAKYGENNA